MITSGKEFKTKNTRRLVMSRQIYYKNFSKKERKDFETLQRECAEYSWRHWRKRKA